MTGTRRPNLIFAATLALAGALAGCTSIEPYETVPLPLPSPSGQRAGAAPPVSTVQRVGVCFDPWLDKPEQVRSVAQAACAPNTLAQHTDTDYHLQTCPLLLPGRATFSCAPK